MIIKKEIIVLIIVMVVAAVLGRLAMRLFLNILVGGTDWGGNFL